MTYIITGIIVFIIGSFVISLTKDKDELRHQNASKKFKPLVNDFNIKVYDGKGVVTDISSRQFNLYAKSSNEILQFHYSTGSLSVKWSFKYFHKELVKNFNLDNARNLSAFQQLNFTKNVIVKMDKEKVTFKDSILRDIASAKTNEKYLKKINPPSTTKKRSEVFKKKSIASYTESLYDLIILSVENNVANNPLAGTPIEGIYYLNLMISERDEFKAELESDQSNNLLSDNDISNICSDAFQGAYNHFFENEKFSSSNSSDSVIAEKKHLDTNESIDDKKQVVIIFYKFCFESIITKLFLGGLEESKVLEEQLLDVINVDESATLEIFKNFAFAHKMEIKEINYPLFRYNNCTFKLIVERIIFGNRNNYLEVLTNDFDIINSDNVIPQAVANNFIVYGEKGKPKYIFVVVKSLFTSDYHFKQVRRDGTTYKVEVLENNHINTIADAVVKQVQGLDSIYETFKEFL